MKKPSSIRPVSTAAKKSAPNKVRPGKRMPKKTESGKPEYNKSAPRKVEPKKAAPKKADSFKPEPRKVDSKKASSPQSEPKKAEFGKAPSPKSDSGSVEFNKPRRSHQSGREGLFVNNWSALEEYLRSQPGSLIKIFHAPREMKRLSELFIKYEVAPIPCEEDQDMESGILASVKVRHMDEEQFLREAAERSTDLIIACDHITDTRNLGAVARSAAFFGISSILIPKDRQAPITTATLGAAQGAFATVTPTEVTNLGRTLMALKDCGYWIASADMVGTPVDKLTTRYEKLVLVLGSEDKGVSAQVLSKSDLTLSIPSYGGKLESLNVSVAAGILIHALKAQSAQGKILPEG